jgi:anti-sigma-K factor RskA
MSEVPAFAAVVDPMAGTLTVRPIDVHPIAEKKYTLWLVQQPSAPPISLGTVSPSLPATLTWPMNPQIDEFVNFTVAISLEPEERDTAAVPSGPFAFAGKLVGTEGSRGG